MRRKTPYQKEVVEKVKAILGGCRGEFDPEDKKSNGYWLTYYWFDTQKVERKQQYSELLDYLASGYISFEITNKTVWKWCQGMREKRVNCLVIIIYGDL